MSNGIVKAGVKTLAPRAIDVSRVGLDLRRWPFS
jgi:hypothetical protein